MTVYQKPPAAAKWIIGGAKFGLVLIGWSVLSFVLPLAAFFAGALLRLPQWVEVLGYFLMPVAALALLGVFLPLRQWAASGGLLAAYLLNWLLAVWVSSGFVFLGILQDANVRYLLLSGWSIWLVIVEYSARNLH